MARKKRTYQGLLDHAKLEPFVEPERQEVVKAVREDVERPFDPATEAAWDPPAYGQTMKLVGDEFAGMLERAKRAVARQAANRPVTSAAYATAYADLRSVKDWLDDMASSLNLLIEAYEWTMVDAMEAEEIEALTLANGRPVTVYEQPYPVFLDPLAFRAWVLARDEEGNPIRPDLIRRMTLPAPTATSVCNEMLKNGVATIEEDGTVKPAPMPDGVEMRKYKKVTLGREPG